MGDRKEADPPNHAKTRAARRAGFELTAALVALTSVLALIHDAGLPGLPSRLAIPAALALALGGCLIVAVTTRPDRDETSPELDPLSGVATHRGFRERLPAAMAQAAESGDSLALLALDLDDFKQVNDRAGYAAGDEVLRLVGRELRATVRDADLAARVGGEEFALLLASADAEEAIAVANRVRQRISAVAPLELELTMSAGVAVFPADAADPGALLSRADRALKAAKLAGKDRTRRYHPDLGSGSSQSETKEIETFLEPGGIEIAVQPIVALTTGLVVGYEALARFPTASDPSPAVIFARAHESGLGSDLEAAAIAAALARPGRPPGTLLSVNVSPSALTSLAVRDALSGSLEDVIIEITEHESIPEDDQVFDRTVENLRLRGARIAVDDAGAGYAGLRQLMRVRPDILKLDIDLTSGINVDAARAALVESLVRYAHTIGATVCAEGIETLEELSTVADLDVAWGQGYGLARPSPEWAGVAPVAADVCRSSLDRALRASGDGATGTDARMVALSAALAGSQSRADLEGSLAMIAAELNAESVSLSRLGDDGRTLETLAENGDVGGPDSYAIEDYPASARVIEEHEVVAVTVGDPHSDRREVDLLLALGQSSVLMVPVVARRHSLGMIEVYRHSTEAWTRAEINRARVIASQFASVIGAFRTTT
ncbi:EAL domain-containing protein [Thermoleophilia bacterium SCSIO 60948]|nr:EAL domain-containing protein [Thermoleophilia bacterium SCSIO 60948]